MPDKFAKFLAYFLHPLLAPSYATAIILLFNKYLFFAIPFPLLKGIAATIILSTLLLPVLITLLLHNRGIISSLHIEQREERTLPFILTGFSFAIGYYLLTKLHTPPVFSMLLVVSTINTLLASVINLKYKISIHLIGIGGICGILWALGQRLIVDLHTPFIIAIIFSGLLSAARIQLKAHTLSQTFSGFLLGFLTASMLYLF